MPDASYSQLQQMLEIFKCDVSAQALEKRMKPAAAEFLCSLLHVLLTKAISADPTNIEIFGHFAGVYVQDGTVISLPNSLESVYKGFGGKEMGYGKSVMRVQVRLNMSNGQMLGPWIKDACQREREGASSVEEDQLPEHSLFVGDAAYFTLHKMRWMSKRNCWFLTHARADLCFKDARGAKTTRVEFLKKRQDEKEIDEWVTLGDTGTTRQRVRLIAFRVSEERAQ